MKWRIAIAFLTWTWAALPGQAPCGERRADDLSRCQSTKELKAVAVQQLLHGDYAAADGIVRRILALNPADDYARGVVPLIQEWLSLHVERSRDPDAEREAPVERQARRRVAAWEALAIPYEDVARGGVLDWPDFAWPRPVDVSVACGSVRAQSERALGKALAEQKFDAEGFGAVVERLSRESGAELAVDWRALYNAGMTSEAPVTAKLRRGVTLAEALHVVLSDAGAGTIFLGYRFDELTGVIVIDVAK
jgi:hypothetical protein